MAKNQFLTVTPAEELYAVEVVQVQEVVDVAEDDIQPPPAVGTSVDERFIIMLDIDRAFQAEAEGLAEAQAAPVAEETAGK